MTLEHKLRRLQSGNIIIRALLRFLSILYGIGVFLRNKAYDLGLFKAHHLSVPVISVGNIAVGAMGKTPLTRWLAEEVSKTNKVAILSRGYDLKANIKSCAFTPAPP